MLYRSGNGTFIDPTGKALYLPRTSQNPPQNPNSGNAAKGRMAPKNKRNQNRKNMKKRINESQLRAIVAESVKKVLREDYSDKNGDPQEVKLFIKLWQRGDDNLKNLMASQVLSFKNQGMNDLQAMGTTAFTMKSDTNGFVPYIDGVVKRYCESLGDSYHNYEMGFTPDF